MESLEWASEYGNEWDPNGRDDRPLITTEL